MPTALVQPSAAQAFIVLVSSTPIMAIASHRISVLLLASDRPPPRPARMTGPVSRYSQQLQERSLVHDPHSTRPYASPCPQVPARGPSMLCNDPLRI
ncbi:hypothetical protein BGY98DRAFT_948090 [Russula aff. rugulosa BPL654]|nr:hypothetical protein BGY98DRAFT_948090 [Russula aff. rugulosa BPL654]